MLLSMVDGREIDWISLEESVTGGRVRAARGLGRRPRGRLSGGQSYGARAQNGVPGEVTAAELIAPSAVVISVPAVTVAAAAQAPRRAVRACSRRDCAMEPPHPGSVYCGDVQGRARGAAGHW